MCDRAYSLLRRVVGEVNALLDIALEVLVGHLEELLLLVVGLADHVNGLLGATSLSRVSNGDLISTARRLTPSSMGTEKKSTPTAFAIASPPATPGR